MNDKLKIAIAVIITGLITFLLTKGLSSNGKKVIELRSDTTSVPVVSENLFTVEQVGKIKKGLMDSLEAVYGDIIGHLKEPTDLIPERGEEDDSSPAIAGYVYLSEIDSNFVAKDSTGIVTDSIYVTATFMSPDPLPENSLHLLMLRHKTFDRNITITDSIFVEKPSDLFQVVPNLSAGYGLINKQFDIYIGVGIKYEFDITRVW